MASKLRECFFEKKLLIRNLIFHSQSNRFHPSPIRLEVQAGRVKITPKRNKPITYEQAGKPHNISQRKAWNSWNTTTLNGGLRAPETAVDDLFIRKFIYGTFPGLLLSEVIIKRQHNIIRIAAVLLAKVPNERFCFLIGYTEEILSLWLQCPVKLEVQTVLSATEIIYKYI